VPCPVVYYDDEGYKYIKFKNGQGEKGKYEKDDWK